MKTLEKPLITSRTMVIKLPRYNSIIAMEKRSLPELTRRVAENTRKQRMSKLSMITIKKK